MIVDHHDFLRRLERNVLRAIFKEKALALVQPDVMHLGMLEVPHDQGELPYG